MALLRVNVGNQTISGSIGSTKIPWKSIGPKTVGRWSQNFVRKPFMPNFEVKWIRKGIKSTKTNPKIHHPLHTQHLFKLLFVLCIHDGFYCISNRSNWRWAVKGWWQQRACRGSAGTSRTIGAHDVSRLKWLWTPWCWSWAGRWRRPRDSSGSVTMSIGGWRAAWTTAGSWAPHAAIMTSAKERDSALKTYVAKYRHHTADL